MVVLEQYCYSNTSYPRSPQPLQNCFGEAENPFREPHTGVLRRSQERTTRTFDAPFDVAPKALRRSTEHLWRTLLRTPRLRLLPPELFRTQNRTRLINAPSSPLGSGTIGPPLRSIGPLPEVHRTALSRQPLSPSKQTPRSPASGARELEEKD